MNRQNHIYTYWILFFTIVGLVFLPACGKGPQSESSSSNKTLPGKTEQTRLPSESANQKTNIEPVAYVSRGEEITYNDILAPKGKTLVKYTADW